MINVSIGKYSNGAIQLIDLSQISLLMISFSKDNQLVNILNKILKTDYENKKTHYIITSSRRLLQLELTGSELFFLRDIPEKSSFKSRSDFLNQINKEINHRLKILNDKKVKNFARYVSLNIWNDIKLTYQFMIVDDVWDLVVSKPKSIGLSMMNIILNGPIVGIHTIIASGISYRNILQQLIQINPVITDQLQKKFGIPEPKQLNVIGTELIFTPDDLIFLKKTGEMSIQRFFK